MDPLLLRFLERLTVVLFGGMAIYLGFRLFVEVPEHRDSAGKVVLPWDIAIVTTKVGPGVFFAIFGAAVVGLALTRPLEIRQGNVDSESQQRSIHYAATPADSHQKTVRADARALMRREMALLNTLPKWLRGDLPGHEQGEIVRGIRAVKLALMKPVWGEPDEGFGEFSEFERWVRGGEGGPPPTGMEEALALYRYGLRETAP